MAYVIVFRRGAKQIHHRLGRGELLIGKSDKCDLSLPDRSIARHQGCISWVDGRYRFDDRSGKKTLLNGQGVDGAWLKDRDYLDLGAFRVHFHDVELPPPDDLASAVRTAVDPMGKAAPLPGKLWLTAQRPAGGEAVRVELGDKPVLVGAKPGSDLRIPNDSLVSLDHCQAVRHEGRVYLSDRGSTNGTWVRGLRVQEIELPPGERARVGETDLWFSASLAEAEEAAASFEGIYTQDRGMLAFLERLVPIAAADGNVLIGGESGSGKDLVARAIHRRSRRAGGPFIALNCAGLSPQLLESTLFGAEKGSYTGAEASRIGLVAAAHGGTLFLDEIGDMPPELQVKLLRTIQSGEILPVGASKPFNVDVRFIAASHRDLPTLARTGRFREDLLYRLNVLNIHVPPLRQRLGDVPLLWNLFALRFVERGMLPPLTPAVVERLTTYRWPGNVRQLQTLVERTFCLLKGAELRPEDLDFDAEAQSHPPLLESFLQPGLSLEEVKILTIRAALQRNGGNRSKAAKELDIDRSTLLAKIAEYHLEREGLRDEEEGE